MKDFGMKCVVAIFISWLLQPEQKEHYAAVANDLIQITTNEPDFLKKVVTGDEWWGHDYDPEMKAQSSQWKSPGSASPKKVLQQDQDHVNCVFLIRKVLSVMIMPLQAQHLISTT